MAETMFPISTHLGGFLLHRGSRQPRLSTGCNAVSPRQYVDRADHIGAVLVAAFHAKELRLCLPVVCRHMPAARARPAGVGGRYGNEQPAVPVELVVQLTAKLEPALIQNGLVQSRLGGDVSARCFDTACRRLGHIPHPQVLNCHHRVFFADGGRGLVQIVAAAVTDAGMDALDSGFRLLPVAAEFDLAAHRPLIAAQSGLVALETVKRRKETAVAHRSEAGNTHIYANGGSRLRYRLFDFPPGLNADEPLASGEADGGVLHRAQYLVAVAVAHPAEPGQKDTVVALFQLHALRPV